MGTGSQFDEQYNQIREILDWVYQGFNASLVKFGKGKGRVAKILRIVNKIGESQGPEETVDEGSKFVRRHMNVSFKRVIPPVVGGMHVRAMETHIREAIDTFNKQMQEAQKQFEPSDDSEREKGEKDSE